MWVIISGVVGIAVILLIASWILSRRRVKDDYPKGKDGIYLLYLKTPEETIFEFAEGFSLFCLTASDDSESKEFRCVSIPVKEIYSATNNLSADNCIG